MYRKLYKPFVYWKVFLMGLGVATLKRVFLCSSRALKRTICSLATELTLRSPIRTVPPDVPTELPPRASNVFWAEITLLRSSLRTDDILDWQWSDTHWSLALKKREMEVSGIPLFEPV